MVDSSTYDALVELNAFPEVAPPPLQGTFWVLGKSYNLPQCELIDILDQLPLCCLAAVSSMQILLSSNYICDSGHIKFASREM